MNNIAFIEIALVGLVVIIQTAQAIKTNGKIGKLKDIVPPNQYFNIEKHLIPVKTLESVKPNEILNQLTYDSYVEPNAEHEKEEYDDTTSTEISLVNPQINNNAVFKNIIRSINVYLLKNKGATADFNLIKDITERELDAEDEELSQTVTIPLYLGLMGTMLGIIFGLINLFTISESGTDFEMQGFLGGVAIAMFASLYGLGVTVYNANFQHKSARKELEKRKNNFYTFIQTELLPVLNQSVFSGVYMLNTNLLKFNHEFSGNINRLSELLTKNYDAVIAQDNILQSLDKININEFAKANVTILKELKSGTENLGRFDKSVALFNQTVESTTELSQSFKKLLNKVNNFEGLADKLDERVEVSNMLMQFLNDHYKLISDRGTLIQGAVGKVDDVLMKSLVALQDHTETKLAAIKDITLKEEDLLIKSFSENRSHIAKLALLEDLKNLIAEFKLELAGNHQEVKQDIQTLNNQVKVISDKASVKKRKFFKRFHEILTQENSH